MLPIPTPPPVILYGEVTADEEADEWPPDGPDEPSVDSCRDRENRRGFNPRPATPLVTYCCSELKKLILIPGECLLLFVLFSAAVAASRWGSIYRCAFR